MRTIKKREEPEALRNWRAEHQAEPGGAGINYGYDALRQDAVVADNLLRCLVAEQGGLCAYTGTRITCETAHVEHLKPQAHCERGEDVEYGNLVACWPQPNCGFEAGFGAHAKKDWPDQTEEHLFVSPLTSGCEQRFKFDRHGEMRAADSNDVAADTTVAKLNLDERRERERSQPRKLTTWRREAMVGTLGKHQELPLKDARRRLNIIEREEKELNEGADITLAPFCFVIRQALVRHIKKVEAIRAQLA